MISTAGYSDEEEEVDRFVEWRGAGSYRSGARYYGEETAGGGGGGGSWQQEAARSPWRPAHYQPQLILTHTPSPHRRSATDPNISAVLRPPPPRRRLPPTPQQPSNLNIDQFHPMTMSRSPTAPGYLASSNTSILPNTELSINFPKLNASPTHKSLGEFRAPPGMIPSTLPRPPAPGRAPRASQPARSALTSQAGCHFRLAV